MNEVMQNLLTRRSIRSFSDQKIARADLEQIVEAARYAPSAMNRQLARFTVIQRPALLETLAAVIRDALGREDDYNFYGANVMILASNERENAHGMADCACALENIFLAAHSLGIGSVWINQLKGICDQSAVREVLRECQLPEEHVVFGCAALGYPSVGSAPKAINRIETVEWLL